MTKMSTGKVRENFSDVLNRVAYRGERIMLSRRGKDVAALVSVEDIHLLEKFIEEMEDRSDLSEAKKAWGEQADKPASSWKEAKTRLRGK